MSPAVDRRWRARGEARVAGLLGAADWEHRTGRLQAHGWEFGFRTNAVDVGVHLEGLLSALRVSGSPPHWYSLLRTPKRGWRRHRLYRDGRRILDTPDPGRAVQHLLWDVNQQASRQTTDRLLIHASVVAYDGRALVLSGRSGAGKTTMAAALVGAGLDYLTDEAAGIDLETLDIHPYPKPLSLEAGSQALFPHLAPAAGPSNDAGHLRGPWQVHPDRIRLGAVSPAVPARWIVVPRYVRGATTTLRAQRRVETLAVLMAQGLNLHRFGRLGFERLAELVRRCETYELVMGDLPTACEAVLDLLGRMPEDGTGG